jgi:diguanylate cyclase (GGDEF)-like protein
MDDKGKIKLLEKSVKKLKAEVRDLKNLIKQYKYDDLTGFLKRADFNDRFDELWYEWENFGHRFIVAMVDLNGLHELNREMSFEAGDEFITETADQLKELFEDTNIFRVGGDEFMLLKRGNGEDKFVERLEKLTNIEYGVATSYSGNYENAAELFNDVDSQIIKKKGPVRRYCNMKDCKTVDDLKDKLRQCEEN